MTADLITAGLVAPRDVVDGAIEIRIAGGRRDGTRRIERPLQRSIIVKRDTGTDLAWLEHEAAMLRRIGAVAPRGELAPAPVGTPEREPMLAMEVVEGETLSALTSRIGTPPATVGAAIGRMLAQVHGLGPDLGDGGPAGGVPAAFDLARPGVAQYTGLGDSALDALGVAQRRGVCDLVAELAGEWDSRCLIHGDVRPSNVLVRDAEGDAPHVTLIDWESAARGDPAWDVGALFGHLLYEWAGSVPRDAALLTSSAATGSLPAIHAFAGTAWRAYRSAREPKRGDLLRAVRYAGAVLFEVSIALGVTGDEVSRAQTAPLQLAQNVLKEPVNAGRDLLGLTVPELFS